MEAAVSLTPGLESPTVSRCIARAGSPSGPWCRAGRPAADGRALRHRRARHPAHRHPCLPALTAGGLVLPHTWRPFGARIAASVGGACCWWCAWSRGSVLGRDPGTVHAVPALTLVFLFGLAFLAWFALVRSRVVADADRLVVVNGYRTHVYEWAEVVAIRLRRARRGRPSTSPTARRSAMAIQGSDGARARTAVRQLRALCWRLGRRMPHDTETRHRPRRPGDGSPARRLRNASAGAVIGSTASDRRAVAGTSSAV